MSILDLDFLRGSKVGLLGGSFNPPHAGHLAISKKALEMGLDYVIWLVVPQNPLKPPYELNLETRTNLALELTQKEEKIIISNIEAEIKTTNTYDTLLFLTSHLKSTRFIWIMGVDCLENFHLWENYDKYRNIVDVIIFNRPGYETLLSTSTSGKILKPKTCKKYETGVIFIQETISNLSSTELRKQGKS